MKKNNKEESLTLGQWVFAIFFALVWAAMIYGMVQLGIWFIT